jgi:hypothetical protein
MEQLLMLDMGLNTFDLLLTCADIWFESDIYWGPEKNFWLK